MPKSATLPDGWKLVRLGDIATPIREKAGDRELETLSISAGVGFVNQASKFGRELSGKQYVNYSVLRRGDFSFNKGNSRRYPYGCTYMLRDRTIAAVPNAFYSFNIKDQCDDFFEQMFMHGYLNRQLKKLINTGVRDDGLFNLYESDFYGCTIPLPPLAEQRRIAEILTTQDRLIDLKTRLIAAKKQQKKWLMQNLLTGKVRLPGFGGKWEKVKIGAVATVIGGTTPDTENAEYWDNGENIWLTPADLSELPSKYASDSQRKVTDKGVQKATGALLPAGSVIISCRAPVGYCAIVTMPFTFNQGCKAVLCKEDNALYIYFCLSNSKADLERVSSGTTFIELSKRELENFALMLPLLEEQTAIASRLSTVDKEIQLLEQELEAQKKVKKWLMQQLLTGKIRVKGAENNV